MSDQVDTEQDDQTVVTTEPVTTTRFKPWKAFLIITLVLGGVFPLIAWIGYEQYQRAGFDGSDPS
jgi:zinc transporter ZupT